MGDLMVCPERYICGSPLCPHKEPHKKAHSCISVVTKHPCPLCTAYAPLPGKDMCHAAIPVVNGDAKGYNVDVGV